MIEGIDITLWQWGILIFCGILIGMSKAGVVGISMIVIPLMAYIFGGRLSTGVMLPMLIMADGFVIFFYRKKALWKTIGKLAPWVAIGVISGAVTGQYVDDGVFKDLMAIIILLSLGLMIWKEIKGAKLDVPENSATAGSAGVLGGFSSMIGNAAGPVMSVYFLLMKLNKEAFVSTRAWFFFLMNVFKLPFHIFAWGTVTTSSIVFDLKMLPAIAAGAFLGKLIVNLFPEKAFRYFVIGATFVSVVVLLVK